jgi:hypothetical protein
MIYEWKCPVCGRISEVQRSVKDIDVRPTDEELAHEAECPDKGLNTELVRIVSKSNVPFETLRDRGMFERLD